VAHIHNVKQISFHVQCRRESPGVGDAFGPYPYPYPCPNPYPYPYPYPKSPLSVAFSTAWARGWYWLERPPFLHRTDSAI